MPVIDRPAQEGASSAGAQSDDPGALLEKARRQREAAENGPQTGGAQSRDKFLKEMLEESLDD